MCWVSSVRDFRCSKFMCQAECRDLSGHGPFRPTFLSEGLPTLSISSHRRENFHDSRTNQQPSRRDVSSFRDRYQPQGREL